MNSQGSSGCIAPATSPGRFRRTGKPPFFLIACVTVTGILANTLIAPATPDIVRDLGVGHSAIGLLLASATAPGIFLAPVIGVLADRFGRRELLVPCLVLFGVSGGLSSFAGSFPVLLALRFGQGMGSAGLVNLGVVLIADHWDGAERARLIGRNAAILTGSIVVLPPIGGLLTSLGGWRLTFVPYWIALVTALAAYLILPRGRRREGSLREQLDAVRPYLASPVVRGCFVLGFSLFALVFGIFLDLVPVHLSQEFGVGAGGRGLLLGAPAVTSTIAALNVARLRARFGGARLVSAGFILFVAGFALIAGAPSLPVVVLGCLVYGLAEGVVIPTLQETVASSAPAESRGAVMAVFIGVSRAGQTLGPLAASAGLVALGAARTIAVGAGFTAVLAAVQPVVLRRRTLAARRRNT